MGLLSAFRDLLHLAVSTGAIPDMSVSPNIAFLNPFGTTRLFALSCASAPQPMLPSTLR